MKTSFCYFFLDSLVKSSNFKLSITTQQVLHLCITLLLLCQNLRLIWTPNFISQNPSQTSTIWKVTNTSSIESLLSCFPNFQVSSMMLASLPLLAFTLASLQILIIRFYNKSWKILLFILQALLQAQETLLFIPITLILLMIFKYADSSSLNIDELSENISSGVLNYGAEGSFLSVVSLIALLISVAVWKGCKYEISHFKAKENLTSKFFCDSDLMEKALVFVRCLLYVQISKNFYEVFLIVSLMIYILQAWIQYVYLEYYNNFMNKLKIFESFEGILFSLGFLTGNFLKSENVVVILILALQPYIVIVARYACDYRAEQIVNEISEKPTKIQFEHFFRQKLRNKEKISGFFESTQKFLEESKHELIFILEALYCKAVLNNSMLGLNKLCVYKWNSLNIFTNFHIYQTYLLLEQSLEPSNGIKTVIFLSELEKIIQEEEKYFISLAKLSIELQNPNPSLSRLKKTVRAVTKNRIRVKDIYEKFLELYPNSTIGFEMYGTFLIEVLNDSANGKPIVDKAKFEKNSKKTKKGKNIFNDLTANLMLVGGCPQNLGKVLYISRPLCHMLKIKYIDSKKHRLNDFIPKPYRACHDYYMKHFFNHAETNKFLPQYPFVMLTAEEFLTECEIHAENITKGEISIFVIHIEKLKLNREVAIISRDGEIYATSKGFGTVIGYEDRNFAGENLRSLVEDELKEGLNFVKVQDARTGFLISIEIIVETKKVISTDIIFVYCSKDVNQHKHTFKFFSERQAFMVVPQVAQTSKAKLEGHSFNKGCDVMSSGYDETVVTKSLMITLPVNKKKNILFSGSKKYFTAFQVFYYTMFLLFIVIGVIVLIYTGDQVSHSTNLDSINIFGNYKYMACYFSLMTKATQLTDTLQSAPLFDLQDIYSLKQDIKGYKAELLNRYTQWSYCPATDMFIENDFLVYLKNSTRISNYINEILVFDSVADSFYNKVLNGEKDYEEEVFYILINFFRLSYIDFDKLHDQITACEEIKVSLLKTQVNYFFVSASAVIFMVYIILFTIVFLLSRRLDEIWRVFYKSASYGIPVLEPVIVERISTFHKQLPQKSDLILKLAIPSPYKKLHHSFFYIIRFSVFLCILVVAYLVSNLILYEDLNSLLIKRADLNNIELDRRSYITQLSFFVLDSIEKDYTGAYCKYLQEINPYKSPEQEKENVISNLQSTEMQYFTNDLEHFYSSYDWGMLFDAVLNEDNFLKYGILLSFSFIIQESSYLYSTNASYSELVQYFYNLKNLTWVFNNTKTDQINSANSVINQAIQNLIVFFAVCFVLLIILVIFWYRPLIAEEKEMVDLLEKLMESFPSIKIDKN